MKDAAKTKKQLLAELTALRGELDTLRQQVAGEDIPAVKRRLAVERVRAEAMAMRSSEDLRKVVAVMWQEMVKLGVETPGCSFQFVEAGEERVTTCLAIENPRRHAISWTSPSLKELDESTVVYMEELAISFFTDPVGSPFVDFVERWHAGKPWSVNLNESQNWPGLGFRDISGADVEFPGPGWAGSWVVHNVPFQYGTVGFREREYSAEHVTIARELTKALELGYLRYFDFQQLEETHRKLQETQAQMIAELEKELQTAHDLQMSLMPTEAPNVPGFDFAGRCFTANHVGGDFFKYYFLPQGHFLGLLADVTGHAMEAAVPLLMFSGLLESQVELGGTIEELFGRLNRSLHRTLPDHTFVCLVMGELDPATRRFRFSNSGCPYPYHYRAATGAVAELRVDAYPLGVRPDTTYQTIEVQLEPGDRVVFCSDGLIEAANGAGEMFGFERTGEVIRKGCQEDLSAEALLGRIMGEVTGFRGETPQGDDQTVVVLKVDH